MVSFWRRLIHVRRREEEDGVICICDGLLRIWDDKVLWMECKGREWKMVLMDVKSL